MSTRTEKKKGVATGSLKTRIEPYLYLAPFAIGVIFFTLYPIVNVFLLSFKEGYNFITRDFTSWGLGNYLYVLKDPYFLQGYKNTFMYVFIVIPISTCIAVVVATLLNQKIRFSAVFQTAYFLPMVTSTIAIGFAWRFMFNYKSGVINYLLSFLGVEAINWLQVPTYNFPALCIYGIWSILPFTIILLLSGLQNIDPMYYTAAKVDGAGPIKSFFRITLPLLAPTIFLVVCVNTISTFKVYNEIFPLFQGPGISNNLFTVVYYIYYQFRVKTPARYGYAAAAAVLLFVTIFIFTMIQRWVEAKTKN